VLVTFKRFLRERRQRTTVKKHLQIFLNEICNAATVSAVLLSGNVRSIFEVKDLRGQSTPLRVVMG
jgi:hypothetical protein